MNLACLLFDHQYKDYRKVDGNTTEIQCKRCEEKFVYFDDTQYIIPLDEEIRKEHDKIIMEQLKTNNA